MSGTQRAKLITKLQAALKKNYSTPPATPSRPLLEHALYASLLEDCSADLADEGLVKLEQDYFDWNEVRVTTVSELKTVLSSLPEPQRSAQRLKNNLQGIFEEFYSFDLDHLKKENLGKAVAKFESLPSMTPFVLSYIIQHGLGGHSIPIDYSAMVVMLVTGIASQSEAAGGRVPGLERAIPKNKGIEFSQLLHQPAVALSVDPKDKKARAFLESVAKGSSGALDEWLESKAAAKQRIATRKAEERETAKIEAKEAEEEAKQIAAEKASKSAPKKPVKKPMTAAEQAIQTAERVARAKKAAARKSAKKTTSTESRPIKKREEPAEPKAVASKPTPPKKPEAKKSDSKKTAAKVDGTTDAKKKPVSKKTSASKPKDAAAKKASPKNADESKPLSKKKKVATKSTKSKPPAAKSKSASSSRGKKATNRKLTKRKPR